MVAADKTQVEETAALSLWVDGKSVPAMIVWLSQTDVEIILEGDAALEVSQVAALLVADFISLPMRARAVEGAHASLQFNQPLHGSVVQLITQSLPGAGIEDTIEAMEEAAMPENHFADLEAWLEEDEEELLFEVDLAEFGDTVLQAA